MRFIIMLQLYKIVLPKKLFVCFVFIKWRRTRKMIYDITNLMQHQVSKASRVLELKDKCKDLVRRLRSVNVALSG
jgi:hypothetical protein